MFNDYEYVYDQVVIVCGRHLARFYRGQKEVVYDANSLLLTISNLKNNNRDASQYQHALKELIFAQNTQSLEKV